MSIHVFVLRACAAAAVAFALFAPPAVSPVAACDLCAVYTATIMPDHKPGVWLGLGQQFTSFGTVRDGTGKEANPASEWMESSITQVAIGWSSGERWGMQLNIPLIARRYRRLDDDGGIDKGDEKGVGDATIVAHYDVLSDAYTRGVYVVRLLGGLKLATGDSDRLGAELAAHSDDDHDHAEFRARRRGTVAADDDHHESSAVHDHDLALGSGSLDGLIGASALWTRDRFRMSAEIQYMLRTEGDFDYEYADDLTWALAPGLYLKLGHTYTLNVAARVSGEAKGTDTQAGERVADSGITAVYAGPRLTLTEGLGLHFDTGVEFPLYQNTTALQLVPDYRVHLATSVRF